MTPENLRYHAAGHLAAASLIAQSHPEAARIVLGVIKAFLEAPGVDNPPQFRETVEKAIKNPALEVRNIISLEAMFCDPHNTALEEGGIRLGKG